jgi:hypothetical protein
MEVIWKEGLVQISNYPKLKAEIDFSLRLEMTKRETIGHIKFLGCIRDETEKRLNYNTN